MLLGYKEQTSKSMKRVASFSLFSHCRSVVTLLNQWVQVPSTSKETLTWFSLILSECPNHRRCIGRAWMGHVPLLRLALADQGVGWIGPCWPVFPLRRAGGTSCFATGISGVGNRLLRDTSPWSLISHWETHPPQLAIGCWYPSRVWRHQLLMVPITVILNKMVAPPCPYCLCYRWLKISLHGSQWCECSLCRQT